VGSQIGLGWVLGMSQVSLGGVLGCSCWDLVRIPPRLGEDIFHNLDFNMIVGTSGSYSATGLLDVISLCGPRYK
jgi:hypothetical protein